MIESTTPIIRRVSRGVLQMISEEVSAKIAEEINIDNYTFIKDEFGNLHRNVENEDNKEILSFYTKSIYLSGQFWYEELLNMSEPELEPLKIKEGKKAQQVLDVLKEQIPDFGEHGSLLEVGCAVGSFLHSLSDTNLTLEGMDISEYSVPVSKKLYGDQRFKISQHDVFEYFSNATDIDQKDYIVALDFLEHVNMDATLLKSFRDHLSAQGKLIILVPLYDTSDSQGLATATDVYPEHHLHLYCEQGLDSFLGSIGFSIAGKAKFKSGKKIMYILDK